MISPIGRQTPPPGNGPIQLNLTVGDPDTDPGALKLTAMSSNQAVVANSGLEASGTGTQRSLKVTPAPNASGMATITVGVNDGTSTTTTTFDVVFAEQPCAARPRVIVEPIGPGRLRATVRAQGAGVSLTGLRFEQPTNARVLVNGSALIGQFPANVPASGTEFSFVVERVTAGQATQVPFTATDTCGTAPLFVGGGPTAF
jgi:hypothetical protein